MILFLLQQASPIEKKICTSMGIKQQGLTKPYGTAPPANQRQHTMWPQLLKY